LPGAEERYRALSEQIPAVLYSEVHAPGGSVIYHSPQNQGLLGYSSEDAMQPGFWKTLVHPEDRDWVLPRMSASTAPESPGTWSTGSLPGTAGWCGCATMPC
jgi:PAS domain S-box-containing protein